MQPDRVYTLLVCLALAVCGACEGTAQDVHFSACKSKSASGVSGLAAQALSSPNADAFSGLRCLRWERSGKRVRFEAINFLAGCSVAWEGEARERRGERSVDFVISDPDCLRFRCGNCAYDLSFAIDTSATELASDASVGFVLHDCEGQERSLGSWQLQPDQASSIRCAYEPNAPIPFECGKLHTPCRDHCQSAPLPGDRADPCDPGLSCQTLQPMLSLCLESCERDQDCPVPDAMSCTSGVCQVRR